MSDASKFSSALLEELLSPDLLRVLRRAALPRYVTASLMPLVTEGLPDAPSEPKKLPFFEEASWDTSGSTYVLDADTRKTLLARWSDDEEELSILSAKLADHFLAEGKPIDALLHRLGIPQRRGEALAELERTVDDRVRAGDLAGAYDCLRALTENPLLHVNQFVTGAEWDRLQRELPPRIARRTRWLREREATRTYYARGFEDPAWEKLLAGPQWILRVHAPGGYGKTMFVQNLIARTCAEQEIPVARIDFDYVAHLVDASNQPWRLLLLIARQLDDQLPGNPFKGLLDNWGQYEARTLARRRNDPAVRMPRDIEEIRGGEEVSSKFRDILAESRKTQPTVIALDTMENLLHTEGTAFLDIIGELAAVHDEVPGLRLVLSGRVNLGSRSALGLTIAVRERGDAFRNTYLGTTPQPLTYKRAFSLAIPPFSKKHARNYLIKKRSLSWLDERIEPIIEKSGGNPMKLAMFADAVNSDNPPTVDDIRRLTDTELFHLVDRVIDRIADPRVQWLLRWSAVPQVLARDFAAGVLWPLLVEQHRNERTWDRPERDPLATRGRGMARYLLQGRELDFDATWKQLASYAAEASWICPVPELPDTLRLHPDVRDPIRAFLRREHQEIYHEANQRALQFWRERARVVEGKAREPAFRAAVFQALEPVEGRRESTTSLFQQLLDEAGDDLAVRAGMAREVLDVQRRAKDSEDIPPPPAEVLALAYTELAHEALEEVLAGKPSLPKLEQHLAKSKLPEARRAAMEGRARLALGDSEAAERLLSRAMEDAGDLDASTRAWVASRLSALRSDLAGLEALVRDTEGTGEWRGAAEALARELFRQEHFEKARVLHERLGHTAYAATCLVSLGEIEEAWRLVGDAPGADAEIVRGVIRLARFDPERILAARRHLADDLHDAPFRPSWAALAARAEAMLGREAESYGSLEAMGTSQSALELADALTAARIFLDGSRLDEALRALSGLPPDSPREVLARAAILRAEALARSGRVHDALSTLTSFDIQGLPLSIRVDAEITWLQMAGSEERSGKALVELIEEAPSARRRLMLLHGLCRIATPRIRQYNFERLARATALGADLEQESIEEPKLVLTRLEVLRLALRRDEARTLLDAFLRHADPRRRGPAMIRDVLLCLDRLRFTPDSFLPDVRAVLDRLVSEAPESLRSQLQKDDAERKRGNLPGLQGVGPFSVDKDVAALLPRISSADPRVAYLLPDAGAMRGSGFERPIRGPLWNEINTSYITRRTHLTKYAQGAFQSLGEQMLTWISPAAREVVVLLGDKSHAWIPWQLAAVPSGQSLVRDRGLRCLRRATEPSAFDSVSIALNTRIPVIVSQSEDDATRRRVRSWQMSRLWLNMRWQAWPELLATTSLVHVVGHFQRRRGDAVVMSLAESSEHATGVGHLARAMQAQPTPSLIILDVPWPGSDTEAADQLLLREQFAWEVLKACPTANLLCIGFSDHPRAGWYTRTWLPEALLEKHLPLAEIVGQLQSLDTPPRSFGDLLDRGSAILYTNTPEARCYA